jgi:hypothetical protein
MNPVGLDLAPLAQRQVILLATATITDDNIFANGLFQNVHTLYRMFDAMGYAPILIVNEKPTSLDKIPGPLRQCRMITTEDLIRYPIRPLLGMIEIGMSLDAGIRKFVGSLGGKRWKLYLGNILNIDIETPMFYPTHFFPHHVSGELDAIWVSPHYLQHAEYAACVNNVTPPTDLSAMIAPYVWDPAIFEIGGRLAWEPGNETIVIMEPNISFQKSAVVPVLIAEEWRRANPGWKGQVVVVNGDRLGTPHFKHNVEPLLKPLVYLPRQDIRSVLAQYPSATFILHNVNNEFNYMTLELIWAGFPVIHNSPTWAAYGYYYDGINDGVKKLEMATRHDERLETYKAHAAAIAWRYSPYNPEVQGAWRNLLK